MNGSAAHAQRVHHRQPFGGKVVAIAAAAGCRPLNGQVEIFSANLHAGEQGGLPLVHRLGRAVEPAMQRQAHLPFVSNRCNDALRLLLRPVHVRVGGDANLEPAYGPGRHHVGGRAALNAGDVHRQALSCAGQLGQTQKGVRHRQHRIAASLRVAPGVGRLALGHNAERADALARTRQPPVFHGRLINEAKINRACRLR